MPEVPETNEKRLNALGDRLFRLWPTYVSDRRLVEEKWMKSLRQIKGVYDPEVAAMIPKDRSKAYPRMTAWTCKGTIARLLQIAFPGGSGTTAEKNFGVKASPLPDLPVEQLQQVLDTLQAEKPGAALSDDEIEQIGRDPFLIAYALALPADRCVVTTEVSRPTLERQNRRIPDVCASLGVTCCDTFAMLRALRFSTRWQP